MRPAFDTVRVVVGAVDEDAGAAVETREWRYSDPPTARTPGACARRSASVETIATLRIGSA
jgi:hypothetical protein